MLLEATGEGDFVYTAGKRQDTEACPNTHPNCLSVQHLPHGKNGV